MVGGQRQTGNESSETFLGVDIGKTKVAVGIVTKEGKVAAKGSLPTDMVRGGEAILDQCRTLIGQMIGSHRVSPRMIGIAASGVVDSTTGTILSSGSIPNWENIEIGPRFEREFGIPVLVDNDVYVAALGEYYFGAGHEAETLVLGVISTGIGFCVIHGGKIWRGAHNLAGQVAHIPLFGRERTVNDVFSGNGISENASRRMSRSVTTEEVFRLASEGNVVAREVVAEAVEGAALTMAWVQNCIDPDVIVLGGGVVVGEISFLKSVKSRAEEYLVKYNKQLPNGLNIVPAALGDNIGIVGAAAMCIYPNG